MSAVHLRQRLLVVVAAIICLVVAGCGGDLGASTGVRELPVNEGAGTRPKPTTSETDSGPPGTNPAKQNPGTDDKPSNQPATVTLKALEQPADGYPDPKYPSPPKDSAAELDRIEYLLAKVAWSSAGVVDKGSETDCDIAESKLIKVGTYKFDCTVATSGVKPTFKVTAKVSSKQLKLDWRASWLPVSEDKAVYEATRQAFRPARVTCDIVDIELVRVDKSDGVTCWVTDTHNKRTTYHGELMLTKGDNGEPKFVLVFKPADS
ncbi:hypothetical protein [Flindersiella endophytica]